MKKMILISILALFLISCNSSPQQTILPDEKIELASGPIEEINLPKEEVIEKVPSIEEQEQQKYKEFTERKIQETNDQIRKLIRYIQENEVSNEYDANLNLAKDFLSQANIEYDKGNYDDAVKYANDALNLAVTPT